MSARQYLPFSYKTAVHLIVYPVKDENPLKEVFKDQSEIQQHLDALYTKFSTQLPKGDYHILFVWNLEGHRMTDIWIHDMKNWSDSGPLVECVTYRDLEMCEDAGIASGDSLIVLGREEELRRTTNDIARYLDREEMIPEFPQDFAPKERF